MFRNRISPIDARLLERIENIIRSHAPQAWRVAFSYLGHAEDAADAIQQASMVLARKADQIPSGDGAWPWFRAIVIGEARNLRRKRSRLPMPLPTNAEGESVEPEGSETDPALGAALRESQMALWHALDQLPEAQREAIVLTHVNGLTQRDAAKVLGIPHQTLATNVTRGMAALRDKSKLRETTILSCLPILPMLDPPGGMASALASWLSASHSALTAATLTSGGAAITTGAGIMASKALLTVTTIAALVVGGGTGYILNQSNTPEPLKAVKAEETPQYKAIESQLTERDDTVKRQAKQLKDLQAALSGKSEVDLTPYLEQIEKLKATLAKAEAERDKARKDLENVAKPGEEAAFVSKFGYGEIEGLAEMREADWPKLASTMSEMQKLVDEAIEKEMNGEQPDGNLGSQIQKLNTDLVKFAVKVMGKVKTHAEMSNGEFTHPFATFMMIKLRLEEVGVPLDETQLKAITRLGENYTKSWESKDRSYGDSTLKIRKVVDEFLLKLEHTTQLNSQLRPDQIKALYFEGHGRGINQVDMYSPLIMTIQMAHPLAGPDRDTLKANFVQQFRLTLKLTDDDIALLTYQIDDYWRSVESIIETVKQDDLYHFSEAQAKVAFQAVVKLLESVPTTLQWDLATEPRYTSLTELTQMVVPRIVVP